MSKGELAMKMIRRLSVFFIIAILSLVIFLPNNVSGAWHYALNVSGSIEIPMSVQVFPWVGADQLPNDVMGQDHQELINKILDGTYTDSSGKVTNIGLNNPDSYISNEIANRQDGNFLFRSDVLGSMDYWERSDISKFFDTSTTGLSFVLYFPENETDVYYLYTTSIDLGESTPNIPIDEKIYPVYRTTLVKNEEGEWEAVKTETGHAESAYYQNPITGSWLLKYPSLNPDSFEVEDLGLTSDKAIYTFLGETTTAYNKDAVTSKYYKFTTGSSTSNITVSAELESQCVKVYNSSMAEVSTNGGKQGTSSVRFKPSKNQTYYVEVYGATSITFSITQ